MTRSTRSNRSHSIRPAARDGALSNLSLHQLLAALIETGSNNSESDSLIDSFFAGSLPPEISIVKSVAAFGKLIGAGSAADRGSLTPAIVVADSAAITDRWSDLFAAHVINRSMRLTEVEIAKLRKDSDDTDLIGALLEMDRWNVNRGDGCLSLIGMRTAFSSPKCRGILGVNSFDGSEWYDREGYSEIVTWLLLLGAYALVETNRFDREAEDLVDCLRVWLKARNVSGYRVTALFGCLEDLSHGSD